MQNFIFLCTVIFSSSTITITSAIISQPRYSQNVPEISDYKSSVDESPSAIGIGIEIGILSLWQKFKVEHKKEYRDEAEEGLRRDLFFKNLAEIEAHNADRSQTYTLGINEFADLTKDELRTRLQSASVQDFETQPRMKPDYIFTGNEPNLHQPASIDWRYYGIVSSVKSQGQCGACWSFAATGALESATAKKYGRLVMLSEQNLIDCSSTYGNMGCESGNPISAFAYVKANGGIQTGLTYPYTASQGTCRYNRAFNGATCTGYSRVAPGNETALQHAVALTGPVAVMIDANSTQFGFYKGGIFNLPTCSTNVTHALLVVGYGTDNGTPFWLLKNSWGIFWGEAGYIRMIRNSNNQCAIASWASFPTV